MTELEQRLTNELGKLAEQCAEDQRRLAGQVERLEKQVRELAEQHAEAGKQYTKWVNVMTQIEKDHLKMGVHITKLTDAYEDQLNSYNVLTEAYNALGRDLTELMR